MVGVVAPSLTCPSAGRSLNWLPAMNFLFVSSLVFRTSRTFSFTLKIAKLQKYLSMFLDFATKPHGTSSTF